MPHDDGRPSRLDGGGLGGDRILVIPVKPTALPESSRIINEITNKLPRQPHSCPVKKEARRLVRGWRPPPPPRRERRAAAPPEDDPRGPVTGREGEVRVEVQPRAEAWGREIEE